MLGETDHNDARPQSFTAPSWYRDRMTEEEMEKINSLQEQEKRLSEGINQLMALQKAMEKHKEMKPTLMSKPKLSSSLQNVEQSVIEQKHHLHLTKRQEQKKIPLIPSGSVSFHNDRYCVDLESEEESLAQKYLGSKGESLSTAKSGISSLTFDHAQFFNTKIVDSKSKISYIDIVSPCDYPGGFTFDVQVGTGRLKVRVPKGGGVKGRKI